MNPYVLILATVIPFPLCLFRMKKYKISLWRMLLIYVVFSTVGAVGAMVGSAISGGPILGQRLYGLMLFDTVMLFIMSWVLRIKVGALGDFIAVPIMAVCFSSKIHCLAINCCYGLVLSQPDAQRVIRFPSAAVEMSIWGLLVIALLLVEKKQRARNTMWPLGLIWFGVVRFAVDFFRGSPSEKGEFVLGLTAGAFWSIVVLVIGLFFMFFSLKYKLNRNPKWAEYLLALVGAGKFQS